MSMSFFAFKPTKKELAEIGQLTLFASTDPSQGVQTFAKETRGEGTYFIKVTQQTPDPVFVIAFNIEGLGNRRTSNSSRQPASQRQLFF